MRRVSTSSKLAAATAAVFMVAGTSASAATTPRTLDPMVSLSLFATQGSRSAVCAAGSAAAAAAATAQTLPGTGCVLPVTDAPPPPPVAQTVPPPPPMVPVVEGGGGFAGLLPALIVLGAVAAALILLGDGEGGDIDEIPISPF